MAVRHHLRSFVRQCVSIALRHDHQLRPENIMAEYRRGRYPLTARLGRIVWHDPDPRAILPLDDRFHIGSDTRRALRRGNFSVTFDTAFRDVIASCADETLRKEPSWITPEIARAYERLHDAGIAHSVEVWREGLLVGGGYGIAIGGLFAGESLFWRESHASKVALAHLVERLRARGFVLYDTQESSNLSRQFGLIEVPRETYHQMLDEALKREAQF